MNAKREWKPGAVLADASSAVVYAIEVTGNSIAAAQTGQAWEEGSCVIESNGNGWTPSHFEGLHPVAVIDPSNTQHLDRLRYLLIYSGWVPQRDADALDDILREFAEVKPPRPEEPMGLGAVVEDVDGRKWVRDVEGVETDPKSGEWYSRGCPKTRRYSDITSVRVLSEGVQP